MRIVAVEAVIEIFVLVVVAPAVVVMRRLLAKSLHSVVIHVARDGTAPGVDIRTSLHLLWVHGLPEWVHGMVLVHFRSARWTVVFLTRFSRLSFLQSDNGEKVWDFAFRKRFFIQKSLYGSLGSWLFCSPNSNTKFRASEKFNFNLSHLRFPPKGPSIKFTVFHLNLRAAVASW